MKKVLFSLLFPIASLGFSVTVVTTSPFNVSQATLDPTGYIVEPGGALRFEDGNLTTPFDFLPGATIKVRTGGSLEIFSGTFTCSSGTWQGIEVDAEATNPLNNPNYYPVYIGNLKHGVIIENANIGINCLPTMTNGNFGHAADIFFGTYSLEDNGTGDYGVILRNAGIDVQIINDPSLATPLGYVPNQTTSYTQFNGQSLSSHHNFRSSAEVGFHINNTEFIENPFVKVRSEDSKFGFAIDHSIVRITNSQFMNEYTAARTNSNSILEFNDNSVYHTEYGISSFNTLLTNVNNSIFTHIGTHAIQADQCETINLVNNRFWFNGGDHTNYIKNTVNAIFWKNHYLLDRDFRPMNIPISPDYFAAIKVENNDVNRIRQNEFENYPYSYIDIYNATSPIETKICRNTFNSLSTTYPLQVGGIVIDGALIQDQGTPTSGANNTFNLLPTYYRVISNTFFIQFFNQVTNIANAPINNIMSVDAEHYYSSPNELCAALPKMAQNEVEEVEDVIENTIGFYPNPTQSIVNVENVEDGSSIQVYNSIGKLVINQTNVNTIDLSTYPNGLYLMRVITNNQIVSTQKIVKN